jgi:CubicO group peptidase (beta-lactamase class C family)
MPEKIHKRAERAISEKVFPGCEVGVSRNGTREIFVFGGFTYDAHSPRVTETTAYDLASITKSIPTASLAAIFIAEGKMRLDDEVKKYIPEMENDFGTTIEDLLRYRVKGPRMSTLDFRTFEQLRSHLLETGFSAPPGEYEYTNMPAYVLGVILERIAGKSLAPLSYEYFFGPFQMHDATFFPTASDCAPTEIQHGITVQGIAHDESTRVFAKARRTVGHAGLFSTAGDLLNFFEALFEKKYPEVLVAAQKGLGWQADYGRPTSIFPMGTIGKTGFTGTYVAADPNRKIALIILSNRTYPTRPPDATSLSSAINIFRRDIAQSVFS